jgi:hypothetical protein
MGELGKDWSILFFRRWSLWTLGGLQKTAKTCLAKKKTWTRPAWCASAPTTTSAPGVGAH